MKTMVIIDDEPIVIKGVQAILDRIESDIQIVAFANNGLDGYDILLEKKPDIALIDIKIPGIDGLTLIEILDELPCTAFIVMSGFQDFRYVQTSLRLGVLDYIDKPVTINKLRAALEKANHFLANKLGINTEIAMRFSDFIGEKILGGNTDEILNVFSDSYKKMLKENSREATNNTFFLIICRLFYRYTGSDMYSYLYKFVNAKNEQDSIDSMSESEFIKLIEFVTATVQEKIANESCVIGKVKEYVDLHFDQQLSLSSLGERFGINAAYLSTRFREVTGENFSKYLTSKRIDMAKTLLLKDTKVTDIAEKVGYYNYRYFCDLFKKETGSTPSEYRKQITERSR